MRSARKDLLEGNILLNIIKFSIPMALMALLQVLYNTADRVIVGRLLGAGELAAVGADGTIIGIVVALTVGFGSGASILFGKMVGAKDISHMKKFVQSSIKVVAVLGIMCSVAGIIIAPMLLKWINTDPSIIGMATEYLQYYLVGLTFTLLYGVAGGLLRSCGVIDEMIASIGLNASSLTSTPFNALSIPGIIPIKSFIEPIFLI